MRFVMLTHQHYMMQATADPNHKLSYDWCFAVQHPQQCCSMPGESRICMAEVLQTAHICCPSFPYCGDLSKPSCLLCQGIAKTGSGKTAAFVLPMLVHIMDQAEVEKGAGPIGVIVVPTRELAEQIHKETRRFSKAYQLRVSAAFGGLSKFEQFKDLKGGSEVVPHCHACRGLPVLPNIMPRYCRCELFNHGAMACLHAYMYSALTQDAVPLVISGEWFWYAGGCLHSRAHD